MTPRPEDDRRAAHGFSVLESLVSLSIFLVVFTATLVLYSEAQRIFATGDRTAEVQDNARLAMAEMTRELRMSGYFPENFAATPPSPLLGNGIRVATDGTLAIYGDADSSGSSNVFLYCLDGETLRRRRTAITALAAFDCASGTEVASNIIDMQFTYYDAAGQALPAAPIRPYALDGQPAGAAPDMADTTQRGSVRRVVITLTARRPLPVQRWKEYSLASTVWLRNG